MEGQTFGFELASSQSQKGNVARHGIPGVPSLKTNQMLFQNALFSGLRHGRSVVLLRSHHERTLLWRAASMLVLAKPISSSTALQHDGWAHEFNA